jgi:hypothetical protein
MAECENLARRDYRIEPQRVALPGYLLTVRSHEDHISRVAPENCILGPIFAVFLSELNAPDDRLSGGGPLGQEDHTRLKTVLAGFRPFRCGCVGR